MNISHPRNAYDRSFSLELEEILLEMKQMDPSFRSIQYTNLLYF